MSIAVLSPQYVDDDDEGKQERLFVDVLVEHCTRYHQHMAWNA